MIENLFTKAAANRNPAIPLAERMRPKSLSEVIGQPAVIQMATWKRPRSCLFIGPPGVGKTSTARLFAGRYAAEFITLSATTWSVKEYRQIVSDAVNRLGQVGRITVLFVDEIHRLTSTQQDALLPDIEAGHLILVGATTEPVSYVLSSALLSRCFCVSLKPLDEKSLKAILIRGLDELKKDPKNLMVSFPLEIIDEITRIAEGDGRRGLGLLELVANAYETSATHLTKDDVASLAQKFLPYVGVSRASQANLLSALIKSMRLSNVDAALYYLARLLETGVAPHVCLRRMLIFASEDIGVADPLLLSRIGTLHQAFDAVGMPEGRLILAHAVVELASATKSREVYNAYQRASQAALSPGGREVPKHLCQVEDLSPAKNYSSTHSKGSINKDLPDSLREASFYSKS